MFYRALLAAVVAVAISSPVLADDMMGSEDATGSSMQTSDTQSTKVNINTATAKELMKVKGLNASKARAIVSYRKKNGDFKTIDDLANVKGFKKLKPMKLQQITEQLTVE